MHSEIGLIPQLTDGETRTEDSLELAKKLVKNIKSLMAGSVPPYADQVMDLLTRHYGFYPVNAEFTQYWGGSLADVQAAVDLESFGVDPRIAIKEHNKGDWKTIIKPFVLPDVPFQNLPCDKFHQFVTLAKVAATERKVREEYPTLNPHVVGHIARAMHFNMLITLFPERFSSAIAFESARNAHINGDMIIRQAFFDSVGLTTELYRNSNLGRPQDASVEMEIGLPSILIPGETFYDVEDAVIVNRPQGWKRFFRS